MDKQWRSSKEQVSLYPPSLGHFVITNSQEAGWYLLTLGADLTHSVHLFIYNLYQHPHKYT